MSSHSPRFLLISLLLSAGLLASTFLAQPAAASTTLQDNPTPPSDRPIVLMESYSTSVDTITPGQDFDLFLALKNGGEKPAVNITISFTPGDLIPRSNGGMLYLSRLNSDERHEHRQPLTASSSVNGGGVSNLIANVSYSDESGAQYSAAFNIALHINWPVYKPAAATATPTAIVVKRPQLAISSYEADVDPLQPGLPFNLYLEVRNLGNADAQSVTMIMGGGASSSGGGSGTPSPGGVQGASGEFTNFAPLKSSNIHFIGDVSSGQTVKADQSLIVNTSTNPGAYSVKFSFSYNDNRGVNYTDDQVITLLVFQLPLVDITFYHEPGPFSPGQPGALPIQITNLSRKSTILGNMKATLASGGQITNGTTLVGAMDPGGYFTLDATLIPDQPGPMDIDITLNYTDDFNQPQTIERKLQINVEQQQAGIEPGSTTGGVPGGKPGEFVSPGVPSQASPETFFQKVKRFVKGMLGLDSGIEQTPTPVLPSDGSSSPSITVPSRPFVSPPLKGG